MFAVNLYRNRELILRLVKRDLRVRYKSSVLGFLWSVAKPLLLVGIYAFVFDIVLQAPLGARGIPYSLHVMAGLLPWFYFAGAVSESMNVILGNANLIKKIRLPHEVFPVAAVLGNLIHFLLALPVLFAFMAWAKIWPGWETLYLAPLIALETVLAVAFALFLSALNVFYRDIASAFEVIFTGWLYATPIIYSLSMPAAVAKFGYAPAAAPALATVFGATPSSAFPQWVFQLYMLNPMTPITLAYRRILLYAQPPGGAGPAPAPEYAAYAGGHDPDLWLLGRLGLCAVTVGILLFLSIRVFRHYSVRFADEV